ncbi:HK97 gp10 family phage protein [Peribacillus frigoritolerans]|uniref:HK97 gp10 family phage protein n=1 Tax=Peribacillus frigoritolerans TaxID=450367 RepID=UPI0020797F55|nr:HK97 gp10 family phage protein [Peribacillus frigoritolerans]USK77832.1 HK97 gp10 family phage protein [Peribacillus frigoritolerans]USK77920.1 HK97 gp10 family phage protein [Peribacillus frigoritolerans]
MSDLDIEIRLSKQTIDWFTKAAPKRLTEARKNAVEAMGMVWADEAKEVTREDNHVDTGLYVNSIGYATGSPSNPLYILSENGNKTELEIGAAVEYASSLEKRFNIFARGLDRGKERMDKVAAIQVRKTLDL